MIALATAVTATAGLVAAGACGAQAVPPSQCQATGVTHQGSLLMLVADPPESSIKAVLPGAAPPAADQDYPVRWLVDSRKASADLKFQAAREGTSQVYRQQFSAEGTAGLISTFQTSLLFPAAGCWDADVFTGTALGSMTFKVV
jgi:hypothetical protein